MYTIGIDIGGTNTDAILVDGLGTPLATHKEITSRPLELSCEIAIQTVLQKTNIKPEQIEGIFFGTTHATNAILEAKNLLPVGLIRIAGQRPDVTPGFFWPQELKNQVIAKTVTSNGGYECDGIEITPFDIQEVESAIDTLIASQVEAISVVGVFSPLHAHQEEAVRDVIVRKMGASFPVTLSSHIGGIGFVERENASLLNASLQNVISHAFSSLEKKMRQIGIQAPLHMVQNDGSIMDFAESCRLPIFTVAAGQTNSFIGACRLAGVENALVLDIGGTSTDIGIVQNGYPRRSCHAVSLGGVTLHFPMPDVLSLSIGGGSIISDSLLQIGPKSVARELKIQAQAFGGPSLTLTDVALVLGIIDIPDANPGLVKIREDEAEKILHRLAFELTKAIDAVQGKQNDLPILVVGGGGKVVIKALEHSPLAHRLIAPPHYALANAYGSALAEIAATIERIEPLAENREALLQAMKEEALLLAIKKGADEKKTRITSVDILPYAYSKTGLAKVSVTASGKRHRPRRELNARPVA